MYTYLYISLRENQWFNQLYIILQGKKVGCLKKDLKKSYKSLASCLETDNSSEKNLLGNVQYVDDF